MEIRLRVLIATRKRPCVPLRLFRHTVPPKQLSSLHTPLGRRARTLCPAAQPGATTTAAWVGNARRHRCCRRDVSGTRRSQGPIAVLCSHCTAQRHAAATAPHDPLWRRPSGGGPRAGHRGREDPRSCLLTPPPCLEPPNLSLRLLTRKVKNLSNRLRLHTADAHARCVRQRNPPSESTAGTSASEQARPRVRGRGLSRGVFFVGLALSLFFFDGLAHELGRGRAQRASFL